MNKFERRDKVINKSCLKEYQLFHKSFDTIAEIPICDPKLILLTSYLKSYLTTSGVFIGWICDLYFRSDRFCHK